jgi:hypothetical protein
MSVEIGTPILNGTLLKELYLSMDMQKLEFFSNVETLIEFQTRGMQRDLAQGNKAADSSRSISIPVLNAVADMPFAVQYIPSVNKVVVPEGIIQRDVLDSGEQLVYEL